MQRVQAQLASVGLPTALAGLDFLPDSETLVQTMLRDKKTKHGHLTLILARAIGNCFRAERVDAGAVGDFLQQARGAP